MLLFCPGLRSTRNLKNADRLRQSATHFNQQAHHNNRNAADSRSYHSKSTTIGSYSGRSTNTTIVLSTPGDVQSLKQTTTRKPNKEEDLRNKQRARHQFDSVKRRDFVDDEPLIRNNNNNNLVQDLVLKRDEAKLAIENEDDNNNTNCEAVCIIDLKANSNSNSYTSNMMSNGQADV